MGIMICFVVCMFLSTWLRWRLVKENAARDREYGQPDVSHGLEDMTDRENKSFRYNL